MADIQIEYRVGYCDKAWEFLPREEGYTEQCQREDADAKGCKYYDNGSKNEPNVMPFGNCIHAQFEKRYKGVSVKKYDMEYYEDVYNLHLNCMVVTIGGKEYECTKVILDGKCIYDEREEEDE